MAHLRRKEKGARIRSEEDIAALVRAVEHGYAVARSAKVAFQLLSTLPAVLDVRADDLDPRDLPHEDPVLRAMADLGRVCWDYVAAFRKVLESAPSLQPAASQLNAFLASNAVWLNLRKTVVAEGQMICAAVDQTSKALGLPRVEPLEMEALAVTAGIRPTLTEFTEEGRSAEAWKKQMQKAREEGAGLIHILSVAGGS